MLELHFKQTILGRPVAASPTLALDRLTTLRWAFLDVMRDREFLADAKKMNLDLDNPMNGADLQATVAHLFATPANIVEKTKEALVLQR